MAKPFYNQYEILEKSEIAPDTFLFTLSGKINFQPGQFVRALLPHIGESTFAITSSPYDKKNFQLTVRACGSTTRCLAEMLPGEKMLVRGPYGNSWPEGKLIGKNIVIIAGGMGIVPLRPKIIELLKYQKEFERIFFFGGFKTPEHIIYKDDEMSWRKKFDYGKIAVEKGGFHDGKIETGMITDFIQNAKIPKDSVVLMCGPEIMYQPILDILFSKKIQKKNIYISYERRMECGIGTCQHCNIGKYLVCKDGPIFRFDKIEQELRR